MNPNLDHKNEGTQPKKAIPYAWEKEGRTVGFEEWLDATEAKFSMVVDILYCNEDCDFELLDKSFVGIRVVAEELIKDLRLFRKLAWPNG